MSPAMRADSDNNPIRQRLNIGGRLIDSRSARFDLNDGRIRSVDAGGDVTALSYDQAADVTQPVTGLSGARLNVTSL